ncbi:zinc finger protein 282-like isoform X2 [Pseudophryne corroboree]|uniref:zinc finger protein 282-like isoform X2 n=1 Tax=Pseudophryne corroboree TaxID=495146 RepID=UPI003082149D
MAEEEIRDPGTVTFNDVAVCFSMREWELLADWQRKLYRNVMKEIHGALKALGYEIANPGILVRIQQTEEPCYSPGNACKEELSTDGWRVRMDDPGENADHPVTRLPPIKPDILLRVKTESVTNERSCQTSAPKVDVERADSSSAVFNPELALWIKQEDGVVAADPSSLLREEPPLPPVEAPSQPACTGGTQPPETETPPKTSREKLTVHKRNGLKLRDKIMVLCAYENNESVGSLATQFGVSRAQIVQIIKRREELLSALQNNVSGDRIRRRRRTTNDRLNSAVWEWLLSVRDTDVTLSGRIVREKALQIAQDLGIRDFKASNGWLDSFKKAHNIHRSFFPAAGLGEDRSDDWLSGVGAVDDR